MSSIDAVATSFAMSQANTQNQVNLMMTKQQLEAEKSVLQLVTVATDALKGQVVDTKV